MRTRLDASQGPGSPTEDRQIAGGDHHTVLSGIAREGRDLLLNLLLLNLGHSEYSEGILYHTQ